MILKAIRSVWRQKWFILVALVFCLSITLIILREPTYSPDAYRTAIKHDRFIDEAMKSTYQDVMNRWYNLTDAQEWYNGKVISKSDTTNWVRYLNEIRQRWIVWNHDSSKPYNLEEPEIEDQSMGQASVIRKIFDDMRNGFFVECGAYDGETRSNTLALERLLGWKGLLVEADSINFSKMLLKNRKAYLTPTCLALQPYPTVNSFLMADNVGRLHEPNATDSNLPNSPDVAHSGDHILVQCFPFHHLMAALNVTVVNYFSLDIEGHELEVLKTIPFDEISIETLSVEFAHLEVGKTELIDFMSSKGYYVYSFVVRTDHLAHDIIFVKKDMGKFRFQERVIIDAGH
ncbi:uncharacterized protein LOC100879131 isoform X2 [Megachile rotundata]|uniref:uncharacterized protein LOC100879131 isoform X2 n=1 Tax=Megachile rotundata TaxID=143995 RepID=UPI000614CE12|nr:PREDICTED: uncharacterized protein LOC100879131 isoform X2 [Megachile rotundata]